MRDKATIYYRDPDVLAGKVAMKLPTTSCCGNCRHWTAYRKKSDLGRCHLCGYYFETRACEFCGDWDKMGGGRPAT